MEPKFTAILSKLPPKEPRSRLEPYRELILEMRKRNRSYREIALVLTQTCGLNVGCSTVNDFVLARTKSSTKRVAGGKSESSKTNKDNKALVEHICSYKDKKPVEGPISTPKALEDITRTIKAVKDQLPTSHKKKLLFEYNPDEPLRLQRNQKTKE